VALPPISQILETLMPWLLAGAFVLIFALLVVWSLRRGREKVAEATVSLLPQISAPIQEKAPLVIERSVTEEEVTRAKNELRVLDVEKEILSYALTRLYEAEAGGKLSVEERDSLADRYRENLERVEERLTHDEATIQLYELEKTQTDLVKMFYEKFDEMNRRIAEFRVRVGVTPKAAKVPVPEVKEIEKQPVKRPVGEAAPPKLPPKTKVEERIEEIRAEVMKELERLEQMETQE